MQSLTSVNRVDNFNENFIKNRQPAKLSQLLAIGQQSMGIPKTRKIDSKVLEKDLNDSFGTDIDFDEHYP